MTCPPNHQSHASEMLARNWAVAHKMMNPTCPGIQWFVCGDHWHIGHKDKNAKSRCVESGTKNRSRVKV